MVTHFAFLQFCFSTGHSRYDFRFSETVIDKGYTLMFYMDEIWNEVVTEKVICLAFLSGSLMRPPSQKVIDEDWLTTPSCCCVTVL